MKPHEETWKVDDDAVADGDYSATDEEGFNVLTAYSREDDAPGDYDAQHERAAARIHLASAAPEMARALLACLASHEDSTGPCSCGLCAKARAALKKAGVLP